MAILSHFPGGSGSKPLQPAANGTYTITNTYACTITGLNNILGKKPFLLVIKNTSAINSNSTDRVFLLLLVNESGVKRYYAHSSMYGNYFSTIQNTSGSEMGTITLNKNNGTFTQANYHKGVTVVWEVYTL